MSKKPQYYVTGRMLRRLGACYPQRNEFTLVFRGKRAVINAENLRLWERSPMGERDYYVARVSPGWLLCELYDRLAIDLRGHPGHRLLHFADAVRRHMAHAEYQLAADNLNAGITYYHQHKRRKC